MRYQVVIFKGPTDDSFDVGEEAGVISADTEEQAAEKARPIIDDYWATHDLTGVGRVKVVLRQFTNIRIWNRTSDGKLVLEEADRDKYLDRKLPGD